MQAYDGPQGVARLWLGAFVLMAAFALGGVGYTTVTSLSASRDAEAIAAQPMSFPDRDLVTPLEVRISRREANIKKLKHPHEIAAERRNLGILYQELGERNENMGRLSHAEAAMQKAIAYDPANGHYRADLGQLYWDAARNQRDPHQSLVLFNSAAASFTQSASMMSNESDERMYRVTSAMVRLETAKTYLKISEKRKAMSEVASAEGLAPDNPRVKELASQIREQLH